jgi:MYXO-CTERM domain-containing protein
VTLWLDGQQVSTNIVVDKEGNWSFIPAGALKPEHYRVKLQVTDIAKNTSLVSNESSFVIQRSHYGWSCTTAPAAPATWALLILALSLVRRRRGSEPASAVWAGSKSRAPS